MNWWGFEKSEHHSYDSHVTTLIISMVMVHKIYIFKLQLQPVQNYVTLWFADKTDGEGDQGLKVHGWALGETKEPSAGLILACLNSSTV